MSEKVKSRKRRSLDEKVLNKARKYLPPSQTEVEEHETEPKLPQLTPEEISNIINESGEPLPKKIRKPRLTPEEIEQKALLKKTENSVDTPKKSKKSKRKKKKNSTPSSLKNPDSVQKHCNEALNYLQQWKHAKSVWKFEKLKQLWLINNALNKELIEEKHFPLLLEYFGSVKGHALQVIENEMDAVVKALNEKPEKNEIEENRFDRASKILQLLSN